MTGFKACFLGEFKKLAVRKKYIVLSVIAAVICVATMLALGLANRLVGTSDISFTVNMPMMVLPMFVSVFVPLVAMMAVCDLFSTEYHSLSIRAQLMRPVTRFAVYIAKILAPLVLSAIVLAAMFIVAAICSAFGGGADGLLYAFGAYMIDLIPIFILILMAAFINQLTKSPTSAMFLCIVIYVAAKASGFFSAAGSNLVHRMAQDLARCDSAVRCACRKVGAYARVRNNFFQRRLSVILKERVLMLSYI